MRTIPFCELVRTRKNATEQCSKVKEKKYSMKPSRESKNKKSQQERFTVLRLDECSSASLVYVPLRRRATLRVARLEL